MTTLPGVFFFVGCHNVLCQVFEKAIACSCRVLGEQHPLSLKAQTNLAVSLSQAGFYLVCCAIGIPAVYFHPRHQT